MLPCPIGGPFLYWKDFLASKSSSVVGLLELASLVGIVWASLGVSSLIWSKVDAFVSRGVNFGNKG